MYGTHTDYAIVRYYQHSQPQPRWRETPVVQFDDNNHPAITFRPSRIVVRAGLVMLALFSVFALLVVAAGSAFPTQAQAAPMDVTLAFTHAAQDVGAIDVYIDRNLVIENLQRTDPVVDLQVAPGSHLVDVFPAGENIVLIKTTQLAFEVDHTYQLTLDGLQADWSVELVAIDS